MGLRPNPRFFSTKLPTDPPIPVPVGNGFWVSQLSLLCCQSEPALEKLVSQLKPVTRLPPNRSDPSMAESAAR